MTTLAELISQLETAARDGFTGQRHHSVTRGRVEVYVPEAHRMQAQPIRTWT